MGTELSCGNWKPSAVPLLNLLQEPPESEAGPLDAGVSSLLELSVIYFISLAPEE